MSGPRRLRDELRDVFDSISEPAHPALSARIQDRLREDSRASTRTPRLAVALAFVVSVVIVASLIYVGRHGIGSPPGVPAGQPTPSPTIAATATPATPGPSAAPTPTIANLPPFSCAAQSGGAGQTRPPAGVTDVRVAGQSGYDRFVIQFNGPLPQYTVQPQASARFVQDASGAPVTLLGSAGLLVTLQGAQSAGTFTGSTDQKPSGTAVLLEARQTGDFEGVVHWGLGLSHAACFRAFTLTGPSRLVVDVQSS